MCEDFVSGGKTGSPFWDCVGAWAHDNCNEDGIEDCFDPEATGGCTDTVSDLYACNVTWVFTGGLYRIPEMDIAIVCDLLDINWNCYQACVDTHCPDNTDDAIACLDEC